MKNEINQLIYNFEEVYEEAKEYLFDEKEKSDEETSEEENFTNVKNNKINELNTKSNIKKRNELISQSDKNEMNENDFSEKLKIPIKKVKLLFKKMNYNFNTSSDDSSDLLTDLLKEYEKVKNIKKYKMDPKNFDLLEKNEKILEELEKKIILLENDKTKINQTLEKLSTASSKAVKKALTHLNNNLTKYVKYFLPAFELFIDENYSLKITQNKTEVSINALSGGQRSLIALCYLFTALSYNPSIFYIFDEIDAALDVKYCSQIGEMLKKEIHAQFVVVSLRDEMAKQGDLMLKVVLEDNRPVVKQVSKIN